MQSPVTLNFFIESPAITLVLLFALLQSQPISPLQFFQHGQDARIFYRRYLEALRDLQEENGSLPDIAPMGGGFGGITYETAMIFIVWELYQQYGDPEIIREFYPAMAKWMDYARSQGMPGEGFGLSLADWLAPEETDHTLMFNAFFFRAADLMAHMAAILRRLLFCFRPDTMLRLISSSVRS